jgi:hypothetical protein
MMMKLGKICRCLWISMGYQRKELVHVGVEHKILWIKVAVLSSLDFRVLSGLLLR